MVSVLTFGELEVTNFIPPPPSPFFLFFPLQHVFLLFPQEESQLKIAAKIAEALEARFASAEELKQTSPELAEMTAVW